MICLLSPVPPNQHPSSSLVMATVMAFSYVGYVQSWLESYQHCYRILLWQLQKYQKTLSWRWHKLQKAQKRSQPLSPPSPTLSDDLHRLPPELRLQIYGYLFPQHYVVQPEIDNGRLRVRFGLLASKPTTPNTASFIRNDADPPSNTLRLTLEDGGSFLHQTSPQLPSTKRTAGRLICGDGEAWYINQCPKFFGGGAWTSLLRTSKLVHREVVDILYGTHTFSFFGPEMLQVFLDQASFEGLRSVRHVHLAVPLPRRESSMESVLDNVAQTMRRVELEMTALQHLDVEFMAYEGPPHDTTTLWRRVRQIFGQLRLHSLEDFALKISVPRKDARSEKAVSREMAFEALCAWDDGEYERLRTSMMARRMTLS
jgi:hypothetical protein